MSDNEFRELYRRMIEVHRLSPAAAKKLLQNILRILNANDRKEDEDQDEML